MDFTITKVKNLRHATAEILNAAKVLTGKICILVPDKYSVTLEKEIFDYLEIESSFDIEVSTLTRFSKKILNELDVNYSPISKLGSIILLKKILNEKKDELKLFNTKEYSYDYCDVLFRTLTQFKASQITLNDLEDYVPNDLHLRNKLDDIKLIFGEYENQKAGLIDSFDRLNLLAMYLDKSEIVHNTHFLFLGFDDFTSQGYTVIERLIQNAKSVNVAVYDTGAKNKIIYSNEVMDKLIKTCKIMGFPYKIVENPYIDDKVHIFLADNLLSPIENSFEAKDQFKIINTRGIDEQIEYVAREIKNKVHAGASYNQFGIACYNHAEFKTIFDEVLEKYEIPYYIDDSKTLFDTEVFKFLDNYLKLFADNFKNENMIELCSSDYIEMNLKNRLKLLAFLKELKFNGNISNLDMPEELSEEKKEISSLLQNFPITKNADFSKIKLEILALIEHLNLEEKITSDIIKTSDNYTKKILGQALNSFKNTLDEIERFYNDANLKDVIDIIESASKEQKISPIPLSIDCVQILDAKEIFSNFDHLFILNCDNTTSPEVIQDVGIILDKDIENLKIQKKLSPTIAHLNIMNRFKMFLSFQNFNESLTIMSSISNEINKNEIVADLEKKISIGSKKLQMQAPKFDRTNYQALTDWDYIEAKTSFDENDTSDDERFKLSEEDIKKIDFNEISCSSLENYFKCPFYYFLTNIIKLKSEREEGIALVDVGNMLHDLAKDFYSVGADDKNIPNFVEKKLLTYMKKDAKLNQYIDTPIHKNLIKEGIRFLNHLVYMDKNCSFIPTFQEYEFDMKFNRTIPLTSTVFLRGKIDRVDFCDDYFRIIDYKTGSVKSNLKELYYGKKLQLFLYAKAAEKIFNKKLAGTFYLPVKNSINEEGSEQYKLLGYILNDSDLALKFDNRLQPSGKSDLLSLSLKKDGTIRIDRSGEKILSPDDFNKLLDYSVEISKTAIGEIKSGYIYPSPIAFDDNITSCQSCPYLPLCRKNSTDKPIRQAKSVKLENFGGEHG